MLHDNSRPVLFAEFGLAPRNRGVEPGRRGIVRIENGTFKGGSFWSLSGC